MKMLFTTLLMLGFINLSSAQFDDPGFPGGDPDVPLDGGATLLLAAGAYYGVKKIRESNKR